MKIRQTFTFNKTYKKESNYSSKNKIDSEKILQDSVSFTGAASKRVELAERILTSKFAFKIYNFLNNTEDKFIALKYGRAKKSTHPEVAETEKQFKRHYGITARFDNNKELAETVSNVLTACTKLGIEFLPKKIIVNSKLFTARESFKEAEIIPQKQGLLILNNDYISKKDSLLDISREIGEFVFAKMHPEEHKNALLGEIVDDALYEGSKTDFQELKFFVDLFAGKPKPDASRPPLRLIKDIFAQKIIDTIEQTPEAAQFIEKKSETALLSLTPPEIS